MTSTPEEDILPFYSISDANAIQHAIEMFLSPRCDGVGIVNEFKKWVYDRTVRAVE